MGRSVQLAYPSVARSLPYTDLNCSHLGFVYVYGCARCNVSRWAGVVYAILDG